MTGRAYIGIHEEMSELLDKQVSAQIEFKNKILDEWVNNILR